jgi:predicted NUDIX family NTP pyrophosphohydrolase
MYRRRGEQIEVFLVHPGGPFFAQRDDGCWGIPKGLIQDEVHAWAFEGDWPDGVPIDSNTFELEWPRGSGRFLETPEVDRGEFFELDRARTKINEAQEAFLDRLLATIAGEEVPRS